MEVVEEEMSRTPLTKSSPSVQARHTSRWWDSGAEPEYSGACLDGEGADHTRAVPACPFCPDSRFERYEIVEGEVAAVKDANPVTEGHHLIVPLRHTEDFFTMTLTERRDAESLILLLREKLSANDSSIVGFNIGMNCGEPAGQTVFHAHIHLIPRRVGDTPTLRGGVRGVIPARMNYTE